MHGQSEPLDQDVLLIDSFTERYSLSPSIDIHGIKPVIVGSGGAFIYCYDIANGLLSVAFVPDDLPGDSWNEVCHAAIAAGMVLISDSLHESYIAFDPKNDRQSQIAMSVAGIKPTADSAEKRATMLTTITKARFRKAKAVEHERTMRWLALIRSGADLSDYDPSFQSCEYHSIY